METLFQWLGLAVTWIIVGLIAWGMLNWTIDGVRNLYERMVSNAKLNARQELGQEIVVQAHWFSESKEVQTVMKVLGQRLMENPQYRYDAEHLREAWRRKLDEKPCS